MGLILKKLCISILFFFSFALFIAHAHAGGNKPPKLAPGPQITLVHGLFSPGDMTRLKNFLNKSGYKNVSVESNEASVKKVAERLTAIKKAGTPVVLIGHSQGGFQVVKIAKHMASLGVEIDVVISGAAGGAGRALPAQIGFNPRPIPRGVKLYINYFSENESLGTDDEFGKNIAFLENPHTQRELDLYHVENHFYPEYKSVGHFDILRCGDDSGTNTYVRREFCDRLLQELSKLK